MSKGKELLKNLKFYDSYSKYKDSIGRKETWEESVDDVMSMHYNKFKDISALTPYLDKATKMYKESKVLASQRNLQYREEQILKSNTRLFNCASTYIDRPEVFKQILFVLLNGCGMGYSVEQRFIDKLPKIKQRKEKTVTYQIEDSIQGWGLALDKLMMSFFDGTDQIRFDGSLIREEGSFISGGFQAPGYEPLKKSLELIEKLLQSKINNGDFSLTSLDAHEIVCISADSVLSAGVRRSALICLFDKEDELMLNCKTGDWFYKKPHLARANNTIKLILGEFSKDEFDNLKESIKEFGEPGIAIVKDKAFTTNPCFPLDEKILTVSGWETFEDLLNTNPIIHQDLRIKGKDVDGKEYWNLTEHKGGTTTLTQAYNVTKTGEKQEIYKIKLSCGREVKATGNHHFATNKGMVELLNLTIGDKLMVGVPDVSIVDTNSFDYKLGTLMGLCAGDGTLTKETAILDIWDKGENDYNVFQDYVKEVLNSTENLENIGSGARTNMSPTFKENIKSSRFLRLRLESSALKKVFNQEGFISKKESYNWLFKKSKELKAGFISGLFFADGHVEGNLKSLTSAIVITQNNKEALKIWQLIAQELGLFGVIRKLHKEGMTLLPDGKGGKKEYFTKQTYRLAFGGFEMLNRWLSVIKTYSHKEERINYFLEYVYKNNCSRKPNYLSKIIDISFHSKEDVYCLKEDVNRTLIAGGVVARRCFEIGFIPINPKTGNSCISFCNLNEINGGACTTKEKFFEACEGAAIIGTLQASYTNMPFLGIDTEELIREEALIGVSITGIMDNPKVLLDPEVLRQGAEIVNRTNEIIAKIIGINPAARTTCTKPSGNASVLLKTSSGIHPAHSSKYFRIMQMNKSTEMAKSLKAHNPILLEDSVWSASGNDYAVYIPIEEKEGVITKKQLNDIEFTEHVKTVYQNWVLPGNHVDRGYSNRVTHNVSNTITVNDWDAVFDYIFDNQAYFCGLSFIPNSGDKIYKQAPFTEVLSFDELVREYGEGVVFASGLIIDALHAFSGDLWDACEASRNKSFPLSGDRVTSLVKKDIISRIKKFSKNYYKNDIEKTVSCLKDVHLFHKWKTVNREFKTIDFTTLDLKPSYKNINELGGTACSSGGCEITFI